MTTREVVVGGVTLPEGAHVLLMYASGNHDEMEFSEPRNFDATRSDLVNHLSSGGGVHRCIGASLARMELRVFAQEAVKRLQSVELTMPLIEITYVPTIATQSI